MLNSNTPVNEIETARKLIAKAINDQATIYSPKELRLAENYWKQAMDEWRHSNEQKILLRNFSKSSLLAQRAIQNAEIAINNAQGTKVELKGKAERELSAIKKSLMYVEFALSNFPLSGNIRKDFTVISITFNEAELAFSRSDLLATLDKVELIKNKAIDLEHKTHKFLDDCFQNYSNWVLLNDEVKEWSRIHNSVSIVVDKYSRKCIIYKVGKRYKEFEVELGVNWLGDKTQSGDRTTPEGKYKVSIKRSGSSTIYHKSLEINYPNKEDIDRFENEKRNGYISKNAGIGGSIALHGGGGRGVDWTDGCIALKNSDMDIVFSLCRIGTPVVIVGSLIPLHKIFDGI